MLIKNDIVLLFDEQLKKKQNYRLKSNCSFLNLFELN